MSAIPMVANKPESSLKGLKLTGKRDNQPAKLLNAQTFLDKIIIFMKDQRIRYASFQDLYLIYSHFKLFETGMNRNNLVHSIHSSQGSYRALSARLLVLRSRGLVYSIYHLYYPTDKGISELNKLLEGV